ncbi:MAG: type III polyketide synthase [Planctomycetes bacterium]|nr:type III polyketide synthase [Planctomycetota bacterium]
MDHSTKGNALRIASVGAAFPSHRYRQEEILEQLGVLWNQNGEFSKRLAALHGNTRVQSRHLSLPLEKYGRMETFGQANDTWIGTALDVGEAAVRDALERAGLEASDIGALFFVTVTGLATPSIDARLMNRLDFRPDLRRSPLFGLGCVAGAAGLSRAADYVRAYPGQAAVLLSVELCSLTFQQADRSVPNMIATGLFGDAASAVVLCGDEFARTHELEGTLPEIVATHSVFYPDSEDVMGWTVSENGFKLVLSSAVPEVVRKHVGRDVDALLTSHGLERDDVSAWICHSGGPKVLTAVQESLGLTENDLAVTWSNLERFGNVSSASVLLVLKDTIEEHHPPRGSYGVLLALGPGFCAELVLLRF